MDSYLVQENKTVASSSSSPSSPQSSLARNWEHDVFLSFHGEDVRKAFLSHVLKEFRRKGIDPFIDNEMERGASIGAQLKRAIKGSKIAIVLLSKNYASSSWCLDELVKIMKCRKKLGQIVITIFYEVEPCVVEKQTGDFRKVFQKTCAGKTDEVIEKWSQALAEVAKIAGYDSSNWVDEASTIEIISNDISKKLNHLAPSHDLERFIGMKTHIANMELLLRLDLDEVRMIGIWGPSGIGKSTIARVLFNQVSHNFQLSAILVNIKASYPRPCLDEGSAQLQLQSQMLSLLFNDKDITVTHLGVAQDRLKYKKVLLVLDDVDRSAQLDALAKVQCFGPRSRIIITTEDLRVLKAHAIKHIYKVDFPSTKEAFQIFCMNAFGQKTPKHGFVELAREVTFLVGELPLGLKVMGSYFREMSKQEWKNALPRLRNRLQGDIKSILRFSYDDLDEEDKGLFLHIACFFRDTQIKEVVAYLAESFTDVRQGLQVLAEKSLISIDYRRIKMHNLLVQLGKEVDRKQYGQQKFVVDASDICEAITGNTSFSESVIGIDFEDMRTGNMDITTISFQGMNNLQFLRIPQ